MATHTGEPRRIRRPGEPTLPPGTERHPVPGGGATVFAVFGGDRVTVVNNEGGKPAKNTGFVDGGGDPGLFAEAPDGHAEALRSLLANPNARQHRLRERLAARHLDNRCPRSRLRP